MGFLIFIVVLAAIGITLYLKRDVIGQWLENILD